MKDNLHQVVDYTIDAPGQSDVLRRGTVTHYSEDGTVVFLSDDLGEGRTEPRQMPVGQLWVRKIISTLPAEDVLVASGLVAAPAPAGPELSTERRLSSPQVQPETRRAMGRRAPRDNVPGAAGPDEFADPK
jgi:hypothetical protein